MKNVTFISAGAGSGKTFSLTRQITEFVQHGVCSADELILTTFTRTAASELREKVRSELYKEGLYDEAVRLDHAAIGTIHSITYQLVARYWYLLGISADVRMIADEDQAFYVSQSLASLPKEADLEVFRQMQSALNITFPDEYHRPQPDPNFWKSDLQSIIDKIDNFCIDADGLERARQISKQTIAEVLQTHTEAIEIKPEEVLAHANKLHQAIDQLKLCKPDAKRKEIEDLIHEFKANAQKTGVLPIHAYFQLAQGMTKIKAKGLSNVCPDETDFFAALPDKVLADYRTYTLLESYIDTIFGLALQWQHTYKQFKKDRRLLDFNDVQRYFAQLLDHPEVVSEIKSRYKVALVDEFQDCSPQQVRFFDRLSELMERSIWVGDIKQAIYNFRGTDTTLIKSVIDAAGRNENGNQLKKLEHCWRSNRTIVELANSVFRHVFANTLTEDLVTLEMPDPNADGYRPPTEHELCHWHFNIGKAEERFAALAGQIRKLHEAGLEFKDIAILYRNNSELGDCAKALAAAGIPYRVTSDATSGLQDRIFDFLTALVSVAANGDNILSRALAVYYAEPGYTAARILSDRLRHMESGKEREWLADVPLFRQIAELGHRIGNQSVASAVETILIELNASDRIRRMDPNADAYDYCRIFMAAARTYEEQCTNLGLGCSLTGFVAFVRQRGLRQSGDEQGVTVSTYHKSKGLEWKCVILCSLDSEQLKPQQVFAGVQVLRNTEQATITLFPTGLFNLCKKTAAFDRMQQHKNYRQLQSAALEESKRLMYVGMTRPKEMLVTTSAKAHAKSFDTKWLTLITDGIDLNPLECREEHLTWFGQQFRFVPIDYTAPADQPAGNIPAELHLLKTPAEHHPYALRDVQPSRAPRSERLATVELAGSFAERLTARVAADDDAVLGNCLHHLLCLYQDDAAFAERAANIAGEYGVALNGHAFVDSARALYQWLEKSYGPPLTVEREVPFRFPRSNGQIVSGEIDLIYRTAAGDVLIDYKSYPGAVGHLTDPANAFYAGKYSGQLELYEEALRLAGRPIRDRLICYFSLGTMIRIRFN